MAGVVFFELNEVPWKVLDDYVETHPRSHLAKHLSKTAQYRTTTDDSLSPWTTWPSVHRGVSDASHTITDFNQELDEVDAAFPPIWQLMALQGISTGVCGSLHSYPVPKNLYGYPFYIPDPFAQSPETHPTSIEPFQDFNLTLSRASGRNIGSGFPWEKAVRMMTALPHLGIRARTAVDLGLHLVDEKKRKWPKVRRRTWQTVLSFDIFMKQLRTHRPGFSTFFTNHVASTMHRYWAARFPGDYGSFGYSDSWVETYAREVHFTMGKFDRMFGELVSFVDANPGYELWTSSSMGQAATEAEPVRSQVYLKDIETFMAQMGFDPGSYETRPAMLPRVIVSVSPSRVEEMNRALAGWVIGGEYPVEFAELSDGVFRIHPGVIQNLESPTVSYKGESFPLAEMGFENVRIEDETGQNAYHIPEGSLFIYSPHGEPAHSGRPEVSTLDIAPSLLAKFQLKSPDHMLGSRSL